MQAPRESRWHDRLHRSAFFFGALLLHLVLFLLVATYVISPGRIIQPEAMEQVYLSHPEHSQQVQVPKPEAPSVDTAAAADPGLVAPIVARSTAAGDFHLPVESISPGKVANPQTNAAPNMPSNLTGLPPARAKEILKNMLPYRTIDQIRHHDATATFPIYVAAYAKGDWSYNSRLDKDGNIIAGSIPDLAAKINEWSHGEIKGVVVQKPLKIGGPELMDKHPPFIFFTGHKDFILTDDEVANLRDYLNGGGAIWGDNALAGKGSLFDIAFHREMHRVVPDHDFEAMPMDGAIYKNNRFAIDQVPAGINYHAEPIEHLDIDGVVAILYTPNDYNDLYAMRILPGDTKMQLGRPDPLAQSPLTTSSFIQSHCGVVFRNFTLESSLAVHRLGMNIVKFFLLRWDDKLQLEF